MVLRNISQQGFKSYYVVWKPRLPGAMCFGGFRLNRTMQYGNDRHKIEVMVDAKGLNRTMQYGNKKIGAGKSIMHIV